jgi:hypothetical protein
VRAALAGLRSRIRGLYLLHGAGRVATALAVALAVSFALDVVLRPPLGVRVVHGLLSVAAVALVVRRRLATPLGAMLADAELAAAVEARVPGLEDRLSSALEWEGAGPREDDGSSRAFMDRAVAEACAAAARVRAGDLVDARPARRALLLGTVASGVFAVAVIALPAEAALWARRSLLLRDEPWPRRTNLVVEGFDPAVPRVLTVGEDLPVSVRVEGFVPADGVLLHLEGTTASGARESDRQPMLQSAADPRSFAFVFHEVPGSFRFRVTGGDDDDGEPVYEVRALVPPQLESVTAHLSFPPSTGLAPAVRTEGDLEVPAGTRVDLVLVASQPLRAAALVHPAGAAPAPLAPGADGRTLRATVEIRETTDWRVDLVGLDGATSIPARNTRRFTALPDPRPEVRLLHPTTRLFAVPDGRVPVRVLAKDNYGLVSVDLEVRPGRDREALRVPLGSFPAPGAPAVPAAPGAPPAAPVRAAAPYRLLDLATLGSPEGRGLRMEEEVVLRAVAADNGGSTSTTDEVVIQVSDAAEILRRVGQRQSRVREDVEGIRRRLVFCRQASGRAAEALAAGDLTAADREALRTPASTAGRVAREAATVTDALGEVTCTYAWNRLLEDRVAADRVASFVDEFLRTDPEPEPVFKPALWRALAAAGAGGDGGILGALLDAMGLADRLASGPATDLRARLHALATGESADPRADAAGAVRAADEALALVQRLEMRLKDWETMHEVLEAVRSLIDHQDSILRDLRKPTQGR